ncbi:hypothetical protein [Moraxella sp. ZY200743]|uniref:hypothetical protein n=1 Tax=Moraxella sp. ZY200743 TaxID=2911970 RepID=UPI003D7CF156
MKPSLLNDYPESIYIGTSSHEGRLYMKRPSWDCDWYWGFGHIYNKDIYTQFHSLNIIPITKLKEYFDEDFIITDEEDIWQFLELVTTINHLRRTAEVVNRGGSHISKNPQADMLKQPKWVHHINRVLIPNQIDALYQLLMKYTQPQSTHL